jgi:hypothetical protein
VRRERLCGIYAVLAGETFSREVSKAFAERPEVKAGIPFW